MKTGEWLYLCAAHAEPLSCSAINYIIHTLDGASSLLNSEIFNPEDLTPSADKLCQNIARRLYRIFAHAWFHHHEIYVEFEESTFLYQRFLQLATKKYDMLKEEMITIPSKTLL